MKLLNKNFVLILLPLICLEACDAGKSADLNFEQNINAILKSAQDKTENLFIDQEYIKQKPLSQLINMPIYSDLSDTLILVQDTDVHLYAVGELIYNLANISRPYYLGSDNLELYFDLDNDKADSFKNGEDDRHFTFTWKDGISTKGQVDFVKYGINFKGSHTNEPRNSGYLIEMKLPWDSLGLKNPHNGKQIGFDLAVADNDDDFKQEGKIALFSNSDDMFKTTRNYGTINLVSNFSQTALKDGIISVNMTPKVDGDIDEIWNKVPAYKIENVVAGLFKNSQDLSAKVRTCWDYNNLYLLIEIKDGNRKSIAESDKRKIKTFLDYGWIENEEGNIVWEMHVLDTKHAGGALKNQKIDTILHLKAGRYIVKYVSDESHTFNSWDDTPPETPFYGLVMYKAKIGKRNKINNN